MQNKETKKITGISYDLIMEIGKKLNIPVKFQILPWKRMLVYLDQGEIDVILGIYWTKKRSEIYHYSSPFLQNEARVFVLKEKKFNFRSFKDLIGKRGDIPPGGSFGDKFDKFSKKHLKLSGIKDRSSRIKRLLLGRCHYFIADYMDGMWTLNEQGMADKIVPLPKAVSKTQVYFAMSRKSKCPNIAAEITNYIEIFKNDGTMKSIIRRYIRNK
ncbi:MAG: amino acid ABC transporter substrate-binding protein [Desulfobacterales bacterium]|nr:amino acid ABC transporter substrate-binding protein [Desulfobacterales bacterium]MCP4158771.1 amino acid ABC transporter substrate-binding protein [Deltaproteobacteria bacterium]